MQTLNSGRLIVSHKNNAAYRMLRKTLAAVITAIVSAVLMVTLAVSPAAAAPTGCGDGWAGTGSTYATGYCSGGSGTFRVWAQCAPSVWPYYWTFVQSGWTRPAQTAWVLCTAWNGGQVAAHGIERRN